MDPTVTCLLPLTKQLLFPASRAATGVGILERIVIYDLAATKIKPTALIFEPQHVQVHCEMLVSALQPSEKMLCTSYARADKSQDKWMPE